jgi:hypothetical protein
MKTRVLLLTMVLTLFACQGRRFEPASAITKFRVLGIQASPPEIRPGGSTTISALAVRPSDGPIAYRWEWCPFATTGNDYFECPVTQEELQESITANLPEGVPPQLFQLPDFDLGTAETASLPYPIAQPLLVGICQAIAQAAAEAGEDSPLAAVIPQLRCDEGYEISVRLIARVGEEPATDEMLADLSSQDQSQVVVAGKRVTLWLDSENEADINPIVGEIQIRPRFEQDRQVLEDAGHSWVAELDDFEAQWHTIDPADPLPILVGVRYEMRSLVDPNSVQTYMKLAPAGDESGEKYQEAKREVLVYSWFTTAGALSDSQALFVDGGNTLSDAGTTDLFIPKTDTSQDFDGANGKRFIDSCPELDDSDPDNGCEVRVWSVVRDDRRGQGWLQISLVATGVEDGHSDTSDGEAGAN